MKNNSIIGLVLNYKKLSIFTIIAATFFSIADVLVTLQISRAIDCLVGENNVNFSEFYRILITLIILFIISSFSSWIVSALSIKIAFNVSKDLRQSVFTKLCNLPLSYIDSTPHGDIISRFTNDIDSISDALSLTLNNLVSGVITIFSALLIMLYLSPKVTLVIIAMTPITFLAARIVSKASQSTFSLQQETMGELTGFVSETVGNQKTVKALGYEKESVKKFKEINNRLKKISINAHFASAMINPSTRIVDHLSYILVGVVGGFLAISNGLSVGVVSAFLIYSGQFSKPFNEISGIMSQIQTAVASMARVRNILAEREENIDSNIAIELNNPQGDITFENVDFSYNKNQKLIQNLNLLANPGDLIAIVGPTGAGKTTIVNLLMRFYEIDSGRIYIDGNNINIIKKDSLRRNFGMVLQDTWLFSGTVKDNIAYGKQDASNEEIVSAAKAAYADSFIKLLPEGYDTIITEDGENISQGQKQLLTIARVMLTNPSMLILDEATSSIDTLTEIRVQKAFLKLMKGRTSFVIAHRLSTIVQADTILVLDKGKIIETGNHKLLLEKKGFYYDLYNSQFKKS